jgi:hypothetical protein
VTLLAIQKTPVRPELVEGAAFKLVDGKGKKRRSTSGDDGSAEGPPMLPAKDSSCKGVHFHERVEAN